MTREEQLQKQVEVLREGLAWFVREDYSRAVNAAEEADRIAEEPVEATDWETVIGWVEANSARLEYDVWALRDGTETCDLEIDPGNGRDPFVAGNGCRPSEVVAAAAAWVRAQKEAGDG